MQSKTSLFNRGLLRHFSSQIILFNLIFIICTFILIPFSYLLERFTGGVRGGLNFTLLGIHPDFVSVFFVGTMLYSILSGLMLTNFLKTEASSDFFHSLSFKRSNILNHIYFVFITSVLINILLNSIIAFLMMTIEHQITLIKIFQWAAVTFIIAIFTFSITLLIGLWVNNVINHLFLVGIVLIGPYLIKILVSALYTTTFYSVRNVFLTDEMSGTGMRWSLFDAITSQVDRGHFNWIYMTILLVLLIGIVPMTYLSYIKRKNEHVKNSFQNYWVEFIVSTVIMFFIMLILGSAALTIFNNWYAFFIMITLGFIIVYMILSMINQKSVKFVWNIKAMLLSYIVGFILLGCIIGYGKWQRDYIPSASEVQGVYFQIPVESSSSDEEFYYYKKPVKDKNYIKKVIELHQLVLKEGDTNGEYNQINIVYHLKNKVISRSYMMSSKKQEKIAQNLINSNQYNKAIAESYNWKELEKSNIEVFGDKKYKKLNQETKSEVIQTLKKDMGLANLTSNLVYYSGGQPKMELTDNQMLKKHTGTDSMIHLNIPPYYKNTLDWLVRNKVLNTRDQVYADKGKFYKATKNINIKSEVGFGQFQFEDSKPKRVSDQDVRKAINDNHVNINGKYTYIYVNDGSYSIFKMDKNISK